jgi:immune inhibitor A
MVLLIQFPDLQATVPIANFQQMFNQPNWGGTGSFHDYYLKTSYGRLVLSVDVYGWYNAPNGYKTYKSATTSLLHRAVSCADSAGVDFSQYDGDNDGYLDAVMVLHAGIGAEESSAPNSTDYIWSFRSTDYSSPLYNHNKRIWAYDMFPERRYYTGSMVGIGVMCHEFGHILDLPDLYATSYSNEGVGDYANMAGGPWLNNEHTPCMHDAWSRIQLGWLSPVTITSAGTYTITKCVADSNFAFQINTPRSNEYFLLENREWKGFDRYLPSKGLAIWHINTSKAGKLSVYGGNTDNNDTSNMGVSILQADGRHDLENNVNRGDAGDLYPGSTNNHNATPYTSPNTSLCYLAGGVRQSSGIYISNITVNADSSVTFKFGALPNASYTPSTVSGCAPLTVLFNNTSIFASTYNWNFGDGTTSSTTSLSHTFTNAGNYDVWLRIYDSTGTVVDSTRQTINVYPFPVASMKCARIGNKVFILNNSTGASSYLWNLGGFSTSQQNLDTLNLKDFQSTGVVHFKLTAFSNAGCSDTTSIDFDIWPEGVFEAPAGWLNATVYPNPVEELSVLSFQLERSENVTVELFNMLGEKITTLEDKQLAAGTHEYRLPKNEFPSAGIFFLRITSQSRTGYVKILNR